MFQTTNQIMIIPHIPGSITPYNLSIGVSVAAEMEQMGHPKVPGVPHVHGLWHLLGGTGGGRCLDFLGHEEPQKQHLLVLLCGDHLSEAAL
jgi:hypothetical protein